MNKPKKAIYVTQPNLPDLKEFTKYLEEIWESKWITNIGNFHNRFESKLTEFLGVQQCNLFNNGTLALLIGLKALRITGEVITTPFSFVATAHSLLWNGITPVFCDIDEASYNIDPKKIESLISNKTTAILPVHVYGQPCNMEAIQEIADIYGLKVIYDAAHAFNVKINGESILNFGDMSILSFHATKVFNTIEGGAIVHNDSKLKKRIDYLKNFGFADETTVIGIGINAKMNEIQAAYGLIQLTTIKTEIQNRKKVAERYRENLKNIEGIKIFQEVENVDYNYSYFPITVDPKKYGASRDSIYYNLKRYNIFSRRYFYPLITHFPAYRSYHSAKASNLPVAEKVAKEVLCLPIFGELAEATIDQICEIILNP